MGKYFLRTCKQKNVLIGDDWESRRVRWGFQTRPPRSGTTTPTRQTPAMERRARRHLPRSRRGTQLLIKTPSTAGTNKKPTHLTAWAFCPWHCHVPVSAPAPNGRPRLPTWPPRPANRRRAGGRWWSISLPSRFPEASTVSMFGRLRHWWN